MKKFFQSKGFIVSSLALLCVTILGVCWFVSRDRTGDFRPDESPPSVVITAPTGRQHICQIVFALTPQCNNVIDLHILIVQLLAAVCTPPTHLVINGAALCRRQPTSLFHS